jgi:hypothetical protein
MRSSSLDTTPNAIWVRDLSGIIDGVPARGFSVHQGDLDTAALYRCLVAEMDSDEGWQVVFVGESNVQWQLVVEDAVGVSIRTATGTIRQSDAVFSEGPFRAEVRVTGTGKPH